ncbi:MAG: carboxymuconolactone decarboxylase family protein [Rhodanobacteraceae bacterium]|nr:carboxymuconolactone decarboxylase family protein [Rhodanobacteraceae bacterium]
MNRLPIPSVETAPSASQPLLAAVKQQLGMVPNLMKVLAHSPAGLGAYLGFSAAVASGGLDAADRERIALTVAQANGCEYCLSAHTYLGKNVAKLSEDELSAAREGRSADARSHALLQFTQAVLASRGQVSDESLQTFLAAGFTADTVIEVITNVALNVLTNYVNNVAQTTVDFPRVNLRDVNRAA